MQTTHRKITHLRYEEMSVQYQELRAQLMVVNTPSERLYILEEMSKLSKAMAALSISRRVGPISGSNSEP